jgi:hypothetical protein
MGLRTHNLHSGRLKDDVGEFDDAMFQGNDRTYEHIYAWWAQKKDSVEFA